MKKTPNKYTDDEDKQIQKLTPMYAPRGECFKLLIKQLLQRGKLKDHYVDALLTPQAMIIYNNAFTSNSITTHINRQTGKLEEDKTSGNNYEVYEKLGDGVFDNFIGWYASRRFAHLNTVEQVKVLHIIRSKYGSKKEFAPIAERLGFWPFITASLYQRNNQKKKLLEDVFEAFLGATSYILDKKFRNGVGYAICYDILAYIFDKIEISTDFQELIDSVTKLKEIFDKKKVQGTIFYKDEKIGRLTNVTIFRIVDGKYIKLSDGTAATKPDAKQNAAKNALAYLKRIGIE